MRPCIRRTQAGFTLVELLIVIVIIGMLAALIVGAANGVSILVKRTGIQNDITQFDMALQQYKNMCGEFPPDLAGPAGGDLAAQQAVLRHVRKRFPKCGITSWTDFETAVNGNGKVVDLTTINAANALPFWLGEFGSNERAPFNIIGVSTNDPLVDFGDRLVQDDNGNWVYISKAPTPSPYVYFRASSGGYDDTIQYVDFTGQDGGVAVPYMKSPGTWGNTDTYQIISAGLDGDFGEIVDSDSDGVPDGTKVIGTAENISEADRDNQANFLEATTLEGDM